MTIHEFPTLLLWHHARLSLSRCVKETQAVKQAVRL